MGSPREVPTPIFEVAHVAASAAWPEIVSGVPIPSLLPPSSPPLPGVLLPDVHVHDIHWCAPRTGVPAGVPQLLR